MGRNVWHDYEREWAKDPDSRPKYVRAASIRRRERQAEEAMQFVETGDAAEGGFQPSFHASRHEHAWILTYLGPFYDDNLILDVLRQVKGGKEATVYCCAAHPATGTGLIAAKVYRPRMFRNLRNDSIYREGRAVLDEQGKVTHRSREARALAKKTRFGQDLRHNTWVTTEFETLRRLHTAGADVPRPYAASENAILMDYLGTERSPAPILQHVTLDPEEARPLFDRLLWNVELMFAAGCVHGDLSAHNILYWEGRALLIDFPQAVDPLVNPHARDLLARDVTRVCQYFTRYGIATDPAAITARLWRRYVQADHDAAPLMPPGA